MSPSEIVLAWKDEEYRSQLDADALSALPAHPAGQIQLSDDDLGPVNGGSTENVESLGCCQGLTEAGHCDLTAGWLFCTQECMTIWWTTKSVCGLT